MRNIISSREFGKWSVVAVKTAIAVLAALPKVKEALSSKSGAQELKPVSSLPTGQFGLLLLDESGNVITTKQFTRHEVRAGFVNATVVQQAALSERADSAVLTYKSQGCLVDNPATYREVVRQVFAALADIDVRLLNRALMNTDQ